MGSPAAQPLPAGVRYWHHRLPAADDELLRAYDNQCGEKLAPLIHSSHYS